MSLSKFAQRYRDGQRLGVIQQQRHAAVSTLEVGVEFGPGQGGVGVVQNRASTKSWAAGHDSCILPCDRGAQLGSDWTN